MLICVDKFWNSSFFYQQYHPEFTKCFQYSLLCLPSIFFLIMMFLFYVTSSLKQPTRIMQIDFNFKYTLRLLIPFFIAVLFIVELSIDIYIKEQSDALEVISFVGNAVVILCVMGLTEYRRRKFNLICPTMFFYWLLMLICYSVRFYSNIFRLNQNSSIPNVTYVSYLVMSGFMLFLILLSFMRQCITDYSRNKTLLKGKDPCPQIYSSIPSKLLYTWLDPLILRWYRNEMNESNVFDLRSEERCHKNTNALEQILNPKIVKHKLKRLRSINGLGADETQNLESYDNDTAENLLHNSSVNRHTVTSPNTESYQEYAKKTGASTKMLCSSLISICYKDVLLSWGSKLFHDIVIFVAPLLLKILIQYASDPSKPSWQGYILAVGLLISGVCSSISENYSFFLANCMGIKLESALMGAVYRKSLKLSNEVRNKYTTGEIVNFISVDADRIMSWATYSWFMFSAPFQIIVCLYFLYNMLGYSVLAGLGIIVIFLPINGLVMKLEKKYSELELITKDKRTKSISEMLKGIKVLKMYAWEPSLISKITKLRNEEVGYLGKESYAWGIVAVLWDFQPFMVMLATFYVHVYSSDIGYITAETAFVSLSLFSILKMPMSILPFGIVDTINAYISVKRIGNYLVSDEIDPSGIHHSEDPTEGRSPKDEVIKIQDGSFTWQSNDVSLLKNLNMNVERGKLIAVVGKIGSGKSSLLSALLGEMTRVDGEIHIQGSLAYVSQEAWIQNLTIQRNILFCKSFEREVYEQVLDACALRPDLKLFLGGDQTEIGERGINLSGGQKQRISLARAVYQDKDIYLLDDPLSAVDAHVGLHLFNKVIANTPGSLLANKTRILVTHGIQWLPKVDEVIVMNNGTITERGSYKELMQNGADFNKFIQDYLDKQLDVPGDKTAVEEKVAIAKRILSQISQDESNIDEAVQELTNLTNSLKNTPQDNLDRNIPIRNMSLDLDPTPSSSMQNDNKSHGRLSAPESRKISQNIHVEMPMTGHSPVWRAGIINQAHVSSLESFYEEKPDKIKIVSDEMNCHHEIEDDAEAQITNSNNAHNLTEEEQEIKFKELGQLTTEEEAASGKVKWSTYWLYFRTWSYICFFGASFSYVFFAIAQVYGNMWLEKFTSDPQILNASKEISEHPDLAHNYSMIIRSRVNYYMSNYGLIGVGQLVSVAIFWVMLLLGCIRASRVLHSMLLSGIMHSPLSFFDMTPSGRILNRFSRDMDTLDHSIPFNISDSIACACSVLICLIVIAFVTPWFVAVIVPTCFIYFVVQHIFLPTTRQSQRYSSIANSPIFNQFTETLMGASVIRAFREQKTFELINQKLVDRCSTFLFILYSSTRWLGLRLDIMSSMLVLFAAIFAVADRDQLTASLIGLSVAYSLQITDQLNWFVRQATELETNAVAIERIREYNQLTAEADWDYPEKTVAPTDEREWPTSGRIQFVNYGLRYRSGLPLVLEDLNLEIKSAEKIGIVGRTGAGKSSIIQAILRLVDPAATGSILIDGRDIAPLPLHILRRAITVLPQDPLIFSGTVRENMDPVGEYVDQLDKIEKALDQAHLLEWLDNRQNEKVRENDEQSSQQPSNTKPSCGLDYECGEGGVNLSAGQRQLMCLARALLRESHILILDEATASVDVETDEVVMETIRKCFSHCTVIIIAHRINTIMDCDRVIVLEKGQVVEQGPPRQLVTQEDSLFRKMTQKMEEEEAKPSNKSSDI